MTTRRVSAEVDGCGLLYVSDSTMPAAFRLDQAPLRVDLMAPRDRALCRALLVLALWRLDHADPREAPREQPPATFLSSADVSEHSRGLHRGDRAKADCFLCVRQEVEANG
jgi:hypothetical protein